MYNYGAQVAYCSQFDKLPAGHERDSAHGHCGRAARLRKDSPGSGAEIRRVAGEEADAGLGRAARLTLCAIPSTTAASPLRSLWKLANKLVYSKVQEAFGGRVRIFVSGGAPLGIDTARWFASVGIALVGGLRPHRNFARDRAQHARPAPHGRGRQAAAQRRTQARRGWRTAGARPVGL